MITKTGSIHHQLILVKKTPYIMIFDENEAELTKKSSPKYKLNMHFMINIHIFYDHLSQFQDHYKNETFNSNIDDKQNHQTCITLMIATRKSIDH